MVLLGLSSILLDTGATAHSLTGNWTVNISQPRGPSHIEIWQTGTELYLRTDAWGAHASTGSVDLVAMTATVRMFGGGPEVARIQDSFSMLAFPDCPSNCWCRLSVSPTSVSMLALADWPPSFPPFFPCFRCKFPHCPMAEPAHWPPFAPLAPPPPPLAVPPYPALAPPFPQTWQLNRSTIIHTSNLSGWTDTASAIKYGIISFDWNNAKAIWLKANRSESTCEATLVEQARRVKAASSRTKVLVYRNCMYALQWLESERAVMYDPAFAGFFLRDKSGKIYNAQAKEGDQFLWNYSNASAAQYKMDVVVGGTGGVGAPGGIIDGIFMDDPGPGTAKHPMEEYVDNVRRDAKEMSAAELQTLAADTYSMVMKLRQKLSAQGKMMWLNGVDNADPFPLPYDSKCSGNYGQCGWWKSPNPGAACAAFFRSRCSNASYGSVDLGVLREGSWSLSIATLLLLRQERGWLVSDWWQGTSSTLPLAWSDDLDRDVGVPTQHHCSEDLHHKGVFSREWSGGVVQVNCSDLSVTLPGKTPAAKSDDAAAARSLWWATQQRSAISKRQHQQTGHTARFC
eukprot:SAG31_NODE_1163_length_9588_cov_8.265676_7_plen_569_part_00